MNLNSSYWKGKEPKDSVELSEEINNAFMALKQWKDAARFSHSEDSVLIDAQIYWLEELFKITHFELKK